MSSLAYVRAILAAALIGLIIVLAAGPSNGADRAKVVATTVQITALTTAVAGDLVELKGIIPAGVDPHEFEPTASDLVAIEGATLVLRHGIGLDDWLDRTLKAGKRATVVTVTRGVRLQKGEEDGKVVDDPARLARSRQCQEDGGQHRRRAREGRSGAQDGLRDPGHGLQEAARRGACPGAGDHQRDPAGRPEAGDEPRRPRVLREGLRPQDRRRRHPERVDTGRALRRGDGEAAPDHHGGRR